MALRVALVTCAEIPDLDPDDRLLLAPLAVHGIDAVPTVWDDPAVDWAAFDLVVVRSTWDYPPRRGEFLAWARRVPRLANPADVFAWNTDKRYLDELAGHGVATVPTVWVEPEGSWLPDPAGDVVVKPAVGAGSLDAGRYDLADPAQRRLATAHVARLLSGGRTAMVQPYLAAVDTAGETALLYLGGAYSHAVRKGPMLTGPDTGANGLYKEEQIAASEATPEQRSAADRALAAVPGAEQLLYARVDVIPGADGSPVVVEVELTEPSMFLAHGNGAAARFADAVRRAAGP